MSTDEIAGEYKAISPGFQVIFEMGRHRFLARLHECDTLDSLWSNRPIQDRIVAKASALHPFLANVLAQWKQRCPLSDEENEDGVERCRAHASVGKVSDAAVSRYL